MHLHVATEQHARCRFGHSLSLLLRRAALHPLWLRQECEQPAVPHAARLPLHA